MVEEQTSGGDEGGLLSLADEVEEFGFSRYLLDTAVIDQVARDITLYLRQEIGAPVPGALVRLGLRLLAATLHARAAKGMEHALGGALTWSIKAFEKLPGCRRFIDAIRRWLTRKSIDQVAKVQLDQLIAGDRQSIDLELLSALSQDLRLQLKQAADGQTFQKTAEDSFRDILARLNRQPQLDPMVTEINETSRLYFGSRETAFVGRDDELTRLLDFATSDEVLQWWLVTGPGGMGKSRLALELCHHVGPHWRVGFLPRAEINGFSWGHWQPELPTLLVVDYAASMATEIGQMLEALRLRQYNTLLEMPVRVLLLERRKNERWWNELLDAGNYHGLQCILAETDPLNLGPLGKGGLWTIIQAIGKEKADILGQDVALERFAEIDPDERPLFAALAGGALVTGADLLHWNKTDLLGDWLRREQNRHWQPAGVDEPHANLAALATMTGGISEDMLAEPPAGIDIPTPSQVDSDAYVAIVGRRPTELEDGAWVFPPFEPDILGTYFVLEHLRDPLGQGLGTSQAAAVRAGRYSRAAWPNCGTGAAGFAIFLARAMEDLFDHPLVFDLIATPPDTRQLQRLWGMLLANLIFLLSRADYFEKAGRLIDELGKLAAERPTDSKLRVGQADGGVELIADLGKRGCFDDAQRVYRELSELAANHPDEPELLSRQVNAGVKLIADLGESECFDDARQMLIALGELATKHSDNRSLLVRKADASIVLITSLGKALQFKEARSLIDELRNLATDHPDMGVLHHRQADGVIRLITALGAARHFDEARHLIDELGKLACNRPYIQEMLRRSQAVGTVKLIAALARAQRFIEGRLLLDKLGELAEDDKIISLHVADGGVELIAALAKYGRFDDAYRVIKDQALQAAEHKYERGLLNRQAEGMVKLINALGGAGRFGEARRLLEALNALADHSSGLRRQERTRSSTRLIPRFLSHHHGPDPGPRPRQVIGHVVLIGHLRKANRFEQADCLVEDLHRLAEEHPVVLKSLNYLDARFPGWNLSV